MLRSILAIVVGLVVSIIPILANLVFLNPLPPGTDLTDPVAIIKALEAMPPTALAMMLMSFAVGIFPGAWVTAKIAARQYVLHSAAIGLFFLAASFANVRLMKHPQWFEISNLAMVLPIALVAGCLASRRLKA